MVRFRAPHWLGGAGMSEDERPWLIGLLLDYQKWEKMATILYKDEVIRAQARNVQKYGQGFRKKL